MTVPAHLPGAAIAPSPIQLDTDACSGRSLVRIGAAALLAAFYRLPVQQVRVQASGLAFSRPAAVSRLARPSQQQPCWPHQLRYVQSASLGSLLDAALPYWQQVEAVRMQHQRAEAPVVQQAAGCGVQLSKRDSLRGAYRLPPLGQLGAADLHFLAALAVPTGGLRHAARGCAAVCCEAPDQFTGG